MKNKSTSAAYEAENVSKPGNAGQSESNSIDINSPDLIRLAAEAGERIMEIYNHADDWAVEYKTDSSPLTAADMTSHRILVETLEKTYPVISEESADVPFQERSQWDTYWLIDPLDGTKEFIKRNGEFTVNIALISHGEPYAGFVYAPALDICWWGIRGEGAYRLEGAKHLAFYSLKKGGSQASLPQVRQEVLGRPWTSAEGRSGEPAGDTDETAREVGKAPIRVVASRSHLNAETEAFIAEIEKRFGSVECTSSGSSLKLCRVADGSADVYPRFAPTMEWDTAAADAVCRAVGCYVVDARTRQPLRYNKEDMHNPWFLTARGKKFLRT